MGRTRTRSITLIREADARASGRRTTWSAALRQPQNLGRAGRELLVRADEVELVPAEVDPTHRVPHGARVVLRDLLAAEVATPLLEADGAVALHAREHPLMQLGPAVKRYLDVHLAEGAARESIRKELTTLRAALREAVALG